MLLHCFRHVPPYSSQPKDTAGVVRLGFTSALREILPEEVPSALKIPFVFHYLICRVRRAHGMVKQVAYLWYQRQQLCASWLSPANNGECVHRVWNLENVLYAASSVAQFSIGGRYSNRHALAFVLRVLCGVRYILLLMLRTCQWLVGAATDG